MLGLIVGFVLGIVASGIAAILYERATRPKLTILPEPKRKQGQNPGCPPHEFYDLLIHNEPSPWPFPGRKPAWDTKVTIEVVDKTGKPLLDEPVISRWALQEEPVLPALRGNDQVLLVDQSRLLAARKGNVHSHDDQSVSLALKYEGSPDCHLFSNESYLYQNWQNPAWKLGPGEHLLRVVVHYERADEEFYFALINGGMSRSHLRLETWEKA